MKVVLDTNVMISAIFWKGSPNLILRLAEKGLITLITSQNILAELAGVLGRKKFIPYLRQANYTPQSLVAKFSQLSQVIVPIQQVTGVVADPDDDKFLACALAAEAEAIISGDQHLLKLKQFASIPILTPSQFLKQF
jgi:uncharacterized protein